MDEKIIATRPRVIEGGDGGKWYLYFSVRNPRTGRMQPVKIERGFGKCCQTQEGVVSLE